MNNFDTLSPNFLNQCTEMNHLLTPIAFVLLAIGIVSSTVTGRRSPSAYLRTMGRTFAFAPTLAYLPTWSNEIATTVDSTVRDTMHADPAGVYQQYQKALAINKGTGSTSGSKSWWDVLDGQALFEAGISIILWVLGFIASVIVFYAYLVQKFILYVGYALAPIFIGFLAVRTLHSIGVGFLLGYAGVLCWPIGWGAASLLTSGLIGFMTDQSFLSVGGSAGYGLQNLLGLAALALWLISSTIASPIIMQQAIATGAQVGQALTTTAVVAGSAGAAAGVAAVTTIAAGGGVAAAGAGIAGGGASVMLGAAEASMTGSTDSPLGNLVSSLGGGMSRRARRPKKNDPTGDEAVRELIQLSRN